MKIQISAIGRAKSGPEKQLFEYYQQKTRWQITLKEFEDKKGGAIEQVKQRESQLLLDSFSLKGSAIIVALDEFGDTLSSLELANKINIWQDQGQQHIYFAIGGAYGHGPALLQKANLKLSFGRLTWPHMMVRPMLCEQLYRSQQILAGHPYHHGN